jgi:hypothetical protein
VITVFWVVKTGERSLKLSDCPCLLSENELCRNKNGSVYVSILKKVISRGRGRQRSWVKKWEADLPSIRKSHLQATG